MSAARRTNTSSWVFEGEKGSAFMVRKWFKTRGELHFCEVWGKRLFFKSQTILYIICARTRNATLIWALSESLAHVGKVCTFVGKEMPLRRVLLKLVRVALFVVIVSYTHLWSHIGGERIRVSQKEKIYIALKRWYWSLSLSLLALALFIVVSLISSPLRENDAR